MKTLKLLLFAWTLLQACQLYAQDDRKWSMQAGFGSTTMLENRYDDGKYFVSEDQGNTCYVSADYWLSRRLTLSGGIALEQQGLFTDYADGIGLKKVNMLGLSAGAKYYFFPRKWVFQPHIGASLYTNVLNLGRREGETGVTLEQGQPGCHGVMTYDVQCPALSFSPQIGVDIHLLSSLSLCVGYDCRIGLWGSNRARLRFVDGVMTGQTVGIDERNIRSGFSIGLKMDFPVRPVTDKARENLLWLLHSWISAKR